MRSFGTESAPGSDLTQHLEGLILLSTWEGQGLQGLQGLELTSVLHSRAGVFLHRNLSPWGTLGLS